MGYKTEFNWVLKLKSEQGFPKKLCTGKKYSFEKDENRIYPIGIPIDLADNNWKTHGKVIIEQIAVSKGKTKGNFRIVYIYDNNEKQVMSKILKDITLKYKD